MLKNKGTREYVSFHITLNSNRFYPHMDDESKAHYANFIKEVFDDRIEEFLVYRPWVTEGSRNRILKGDNDPAYKPLEDDILYLESSISHEVGNIMSKLHSEIYLEVCCENKLDHGIDLYHNMIRLLYRQRFGQKCSLQFHRSKNVTLGQKLYALKSRKQIEREAPELTESTGNKVHFFKTEKYKPK